MATLIDLFKTLVTRETARLAAYGGSALLAGALLLSKKLGVELSPEITTGLQALGVLVVTELIRRFVTPVAAPVLPVGTTVSIEGTERQIVLAK